MALRWFEVRFWWGWDWRRGVWWGCGLSWDWRRAGLVGLWVGLGLGLAEWGLVGFVGWVGIRRRAGLWVGLGWVGIGGVGFDGVVGWVGIGGERVWWGCGLGWVGLGLVEWGCGLSWVWMWWIRFSWFGFNLVDWMLVLIGWGGVWDVWKRVAIEGWLGWLIGTDNFGLELGFFIP